jgi:Predicted dehydrogenases and related proteins
MALKKLAMIGCGGIGEYHLSHFVNFKEIVELAGFCDLIPARAERFVEVAGCGKAYTCYIEMLDEIKPDMLFICVPPTEHGDIEFAAIERGIPFFVEKPLAMNLELARAIRDAAAKKRLITASGFQCRYSNLMEPTKKFISEHPIVFIDCSRIGGVPGVDWWRKRSTSGGQVVEQTIHQFDMIRYLYGEPETVFSMGTRGFITNGEWDGYDTEDASTTIVRYKSGITGHITTGCYALSGAAFDSKITFSSRDCRMDHRILTSTDVYGVKPDESEQVDTQVIKGDGNMARSSKEGVINYREEGDAGVKCDLTFIEAVISGDRSKIRSPYSDAIKSVAFTLAVNESMDTGMPVKVDYR